MDYNEFNVHDNFFEYKPSDLNNKKNKLIKIIPIVALLLVLVLGASYAWFIYRAKGETSKIVAGSLYLTLNEKTDTIEIENIFPETKEEARSRDDNYITFTVSGKNTSTTKDINYEIRITNGEDKEGKERFNPNDLVFDLIEIGENNEETIVLDAVSYDELNEKKIWIDKVEKNTTEEIEKTYKLRMWIDEDVKISDTDPNANYKATGEDAYKNHYASIKVAVEGDLEERELPLIVLASNEMIQNNHTYITNTIENVDSENNEDTFELTITSLSGNVSFLYNENDVVVENLSSDEIIYKVSPLLTDNDYQVKKIDNESELLTTFKKIFTIPNNKKITFDLELISKNGYYSGEDLNFVLKKNTKVEQELVKHVKLQGSKYDVELNINDTVYTGESVDIESINVVMPDGRPYTGNIDYKYYDNETCTGEELNGKPVDAGTYCVKMSLIDSNNNLVEEKRTFTINKANGRVTITSSNGTYNGTMIPVSVTPNYATVKYYTNNTCSEGETETAPINAGIYYSKAYLQETENYNASSSECIKHEISPKEISTNNIELSYLVTTYSGEEKKPDVIVTDGNKTLVLNTDYTISYANNENAGEAVVSITMKGNYTGKIDKSFMINKKNDVITLEAKTGDYTGSIIPANTATSESGSNITYTYYGTSNCSGEELEGAPINAGNYSVKATSLGNDNYNSGSKCVTHIVNRIDSTCPSLTAYAGTYDGNSHGITIGSVSGGVVKYRTATTGDGSSWIETSPERTNAGETAVYVMVEGDNNHNNKDCGSSTITINKKNDVITLEAKTGNYTGNTISANTATAESNTSITYIYYGTVDCTGNSLSGAPTNVGNYSVKATSLGNNNYNSGTKCVTHTITKIDSTCPSLAAYTGTYDGNSHGITIGSVSGGVVKYRTATTGDGSSWTETSPERTNAGEITVYVMVEGDNNHNNKDCGSSKITINKKSLTITADNKSMTYSENAPTYTYTSSGFAGSETVNNLTGTIAYTIKNENTTISNISTANAGTYTIVPSGFTSNNYNISYVNGTLTINKKDDVVTITAVNPTYDGNGKEATFSSTSGTTITPTYYSDSSCSTETTTTNAVSNGGAPKIVGTYYAIATSTGNSNYNSGTTSCVLAVTIKKANNPISVTATQSWNPTYSLSAQSNNFTAATNNQGNVTYSIKSQKQSSTNVTYFSIGTNTTANITMAKETPPGTYTVVITATAAGNANYNLGSKDITLTVTVGKATCAPPTGVSISTAGKVTWTASATATGYQISIDNSTFTDATSGVDYKSTITASSGTRTVYVRSKCNTTYYSSATSSNATKSIAVYAVNLSKGEGISAVTGAGKYITGSTVTLGATVSTGYTWSKWTQTSGGTQVSTTQAYSATISADWNYTANTTINNYTITYTLNGGSVATANPTSYNVKTATFTLNNPTKTGYSFEGWTGSNGETAQTSVSVTKGSTGNKTYTANWVDDIKPSNLQITNSSNGNWTNKNVVVTISATEEGSGIKEYQWYENNSWTTRALTTTNGVGTITYTADRNLTIRFRAVDNAGNISDEITTVVKHDSTLPTVTLTSTSNLKVTSQTATLKCSDANGITAYYWGTTNPTSASAITTTTSADLTSLAGSGLTKTISSTGTYYLGCKDIVGNISVKSVTIYSYKVENMLQNVSGSTYTTTHYTEASNATYIAPSGTTITLTSVYSIPTGSRSGRFKGYSSGEPSTTAATLSTTNPTLSANSIYAMWFERNLIYFKYKTGDGGVLHTTTHNESGSETYTWAVDSNGYITRKVNSGNATNNFTSYRYGIANIDLYNWDNRNALYIRRIGYAPPGSKQWLCESGCKTANLTINHNSVAYNSDTMCDASSADCTIVVKVNWARASYTLSYTLNDGTVATANPTSYNVDTSTITLNNPTKTGYSFSGWTEQIKNLNWYSGFVNLTTGIIEYNSSNPSAYYSYQMIRLKKGIKYTISGYGDYPSADIRIRVFNLDGTYNKNVTATSITPDADCYIRVLLCSASTDAQRKGIIITSNQGTTATIVQGSVYNRTYVANWTDNIKPTISSATAATALDTTSYVDFTATDSGTKINGYNITTSNTAPTTWIPVVSTVEAATATKYELSAAWARIFYHNTHWGSVLFANDTDAQSYNDRDRYSVLGNIANYKNSSNWEFLLQYPQVSGTAYNRWTQTSNPISTSDSITGYTAGTISWTGNNWNGIAKSSSTAETFMDGSPGNTGWWFAIGAKKGYNGGIPGPNSTVSSIVNLWARIDNLTTTTAASLTRRLGDLKSNTTYYVWVKDAAGNTNSKTVAVSNIDTTAPTGSIIDITNNVATSQTVNIKMDDAKGVTRYYFGTSNPANKVVTYTSITSATTTTISKTVNNGGTWYLASQDAAGNRNIVNKAFYKTTLTPNKGSVSPASVVTLNGNSFALPNHGTVAGYTFAGWYTDADLTTAVTLTDNKYKPTANATLYGKWNANALTFANQTISKTFGAQQTASVTAATNGTGTYTYTEVSEVNASGTATSYISLSGTTITIAANTPAGTYTYKIKAKDSNSLAEKEATYTITIGKYTPKVTLSASTGTVNFGSETTFKATPTVIDACKGTLTAASAGTSYVTISSGGSTSNATAAVTVKWKGILKTTDTKINVNYKPTDTANCNNATQVQYKAVVNVVTPIVSLSAKTAAQRTYTGSAIAANIATVSPDAGGAITYTYYTDSACSAGATTTAPTNVGTYYVKASVAAVTNKTNAASSGCVNHSIVKSNTTTSLSAITKTFNNSNQAASGASAKLSSNSAAAPSAAFTYKYYTNDACSAGETTTAPKTAGTYYVKATLTGTSNYNTSTSSCVKYTMNKYTPKVTLSASTGTVNFGSETTFKATPTVITACKGTLTAASASTTYVTISSGASTTDATAAVTVKWKGILKTTDTKINVNYKPTDTTNCANATQVQYKAVVNVATPTVSLSAKTDAQRMYTGSAIAANTATVSPNGGGAITYTYYTDSACSAGATTTAPTNVGTYYVKASVAAVTNKTNAASSGCVNHSIIKSNTTTSLSAITKTFNNSNQAASGATAKLSSTSAAISGAAFTYKYYTNSACSSGETTTAPKTVGTYYVKATLTAGTTYNSSTSSCVKYTMNKYTPKVTLSASTGTVNFGSETTFKATPTVITACKGKLTAASASTTYVTISSGGSTSNATAAVTVKWKGVKSTTDTKINVNYAPTDTTNCANATQVQYKAVVNAVTPTVSLSAKTDAQRMYTGSAIAANTATVSPNGGGAITYTYYTNSACSTGATTTAPTNIGTYYVKASVAAVSGKTNAASSGCVNHSIVKSNTTTSLSAITKTFNNSNQAASGATAKLSSTNAAISGAAFTYKYYTNDACSAGETTTAPKTAGTYYVKATLTAGTTYNSSTSSCVKYTMNKYTPKVTLSASTGSVNWNSETTFTATPTVITACKGKLTAASASTTYVTISSGGSTTDATAAVTVKWKGILKTTDTKINVNYKPTDTTNCANATQVQYKAVVNAVTPTVTLTAKTDAQRTYTGSAIAANTATVSPDAGGAITYTYYTDSACSAGATTTAPTNAGTYYVKASVAAVTNKTNAASSGCVNHSIVKSNTTTSLSAITKTFNNSNQAASGATAKLSSTSAAISGAAFTYKYYTNSACSSGETTTAPKTAGTYYVKATLTAGTNYNSSTSSCVKYTMNKYTPSITLSASTGSVNWNSETTFTATPNTISACVGTLTAASAGTSYVTISSGASTASATSAVSVKWKGVKSTTDTKINVNYKPTDTTNCANATQVQYKAVVNVVTPTVTLTAKTDAQRTYTGSAIAANTATVSPNAGGAITYTYYTNSACSTGATTTAPKKAGTYYVKASVAAVSGKTNAASSGCVNHTILPGPAYYAYGEPTTSSTTNYSSLGKTVFIRMQAGIYSVCIIKSGALKCFESCDVTQEEIQNAMLNAFGTANCTNTGTGITTCNAGGFSCHHTGSTIVECNNSSNTDGCHISGSTIHSCN